MKAASSKLVQEETIEFNLTKGANLHLCLCSLKKQLHHHHHAYWRQAPDPSNHNLDMFGRPRYFAHISFFRLGYLGESAKIRTGQAHFRGWSD